MIHGAGFTSLEAAATFGTGYIFIDDYEQEINDIVRRAGLLGQRLPAVEANGPTHRWIDQTAIGTAAFDTRDALAPAATSPTRAERGTLLKALSNRVQFGLFNQLVAGVGNNRNLRAKDLSDMISGIVRLRDKSLWQGTDDMSGNTVGAGTTNQFVGIPKQISSTAITIASGTSVIPVLRKEVARVVSDADVDARPSAIYVNPMLQYVIEEEAKQAGNTIAQVEVIAGTTVPAIMTAAGLLPIIPDFDLAIGPSWHAAAPVNESNYPFVVLTESLVEYVYVGSKNPAMYQLGTVSDLKDDYVGVCFGAVQVKLRDKAHLRGVVQRTTL